MTPAELAEGRRLVAASPAATLRVGEDDPTTVYDHVGDLVVYCDGEVEPGALAALIVFLRNHAAELLDATEKLAATETWAKRQFDLRSTAERERDEARAIVALLADALHTWGQEEDGVPEDGPVAEAYDTALSMLAVWRKS